MILQSFKQRVEMNGRIRFEIRQKFPAHNSLRSLWKACFRRIIVCQQLPLAIHD